MQRSGRTSMLMLVLLVTAGSNAAAQDGSPRMSPAGTAPGPSTTGDLIVEVPAGAVPAGTTIAAVTRTADERPEALRGVPLRMAFHDLQPLDATFSAPVTVTRTVPLAELGIDRFDPLLQGLIVGSLLTRAPDGTWSWLHDTRIGLDAAGGGFTITATTDHGGPIVAYLAGDLLVADEDAAPTPVGGSFRVEGQVRVEPDSSATITAVAGSTSDEAIASPVEAYDVPLFTGAKGLAFRCVAPGEVRYEVVFTVRDVADVGPLSGAVGLNGTQVQVARSGTHTCGA